MMIVILLFTSSLKREKEDGVDALILAVYAALMMLGKGANIT